MDKDRSTGQVSLFRGTQRGVERHEEMLFGVPVAVTGPEVSEGRARLGGVLPRGANVSAPTTAPTFTRRSRGKFISTAKTRRERRREIQREFLCIALRFFAPSRWKLISAGNSRQSASGQIPAAARRLRGPKGRFGESGRARSGRVLVQGHGDTAGRESDGFHAATGLEHDGHRSALGLCRSVLVRQAHHSWAARGYFTKVIWAGGELGGFV